MTEPETGPRGHDIANDIVAIPVLEQLARDLAGPVKLVLKPDRTERAAPVQNGACAHRSWRITVFVLLGDRAGPAVRGRRTQHRRRAGGRCECTGTAPPGYRSPSRRLPVSADHRGGGKGRARRRG